MSVRKIGRIQKTFHGGDLVHGRMQRFPRTFENREMEYDWRAQIFNSRTDPTETEVVEDPTVPAKA
jgi:hypothetical protein